MNLSETLAGKRFPLRLGSRSDKYQWNNPSLFNRVKYKNSDMTSYFDSKCWEGRFTGCLFEKFKGPVYKIIYRHILTLDRNRKRFNKKAKLNQMRGLG